MERGSCGHAKTLSGFLARCTLRTRRGDSTAHDRRVDVVQDHLAGDHHTGDVLLTRDVEHHRQEHLLHDRPEPPGTHAAQQRLVSDSLDRFRGELELHAVNFEHPRVLLDQGVARLGQNAHQGVTVQGRHRRDDRQATDELGDQHELHQVLRHHVTVALSHVLGCVQLRAEAQALLTRPRLDAVSYTGERTTDDEQHIGRVDLDELLVRVLAATLRRHGGGGALQDLQKRLLHTLAGHVTGDGRVLALAGDLVDLVDIDAVSYTHLRAPE